MPELGRYARQLRTLLWKPSVDNEVKDELNAHIEQLEQDLIAKGVDPAAARAEATRKFGNVERLAAECRTLGEERDVARRRASRWLDLTSDVRYALRQLIASPRFALIAIATLSIGLGASTTIFSIANAVLLRPLPYADPGQLVLAFELNPEGDRFSISEPNFLDMQSRAKSLQSVAALEILRGSVTGDGLPEQVEWSRVSQSFLPTLGVAPVIGRNFTEAEDRAGGDTLVVLLSYELWQRRFGGDPGVLDRPLVLDGVSHRVIGVLPRGRSFPENTNVWTPLSASAEYPRGDRRLEAIARLRDGVTINQAGRELAGTAAALAETYPESNLGWGADLIPFSQWFVSPALHKRVVVLLIAVGLLLLMACVNVANLLLSRAAVREREIAVRAALGAGRGRIIRQLLTESLVLSLAGAVVGIALAAAAIPVIRRTGSEVITRLAELRLDWTIVGFAVAACVATGLLFGLGPVWRLSGRRRASGDVLHAVLRSGTRVADGGRARKLLIGASVALAMIMLTGAALVGSSFMRLMGSDLGFVDQGVLIANISFPSDRYNGEGRVRFISEARQRIGAIPGVQMVGASNIPPFGIGNTGQSFAPAEHANERRERYRQGSWRAVTPGYFATLQINLKRGRDFIDDDQYDKEGVVVINEALANMAYPGEDPVGRQLASSNGQVRRIIGVVGDTRDLAIDSVPGRGCTGRIVSSPGARCGWP